MRDIPARKAVAAGEERGGGGGPRTAGRATPNGWDVALRGRGRADGRGARRRGEVAGHGEAGREQGAASRGTRQEGGWSPADEAATGTAAGDVPADDAAGEGVGDRDRALRLRPR